MTSNTSVTCMASLGSWVRPWSIRSAHKLVKELLGFWLAGHHESSEMKPSSLGGADASVSGLGYFFSIAVRSSFDKDRRKCFSRYFPTVLGTFVLNSSLSSFSSSGLKCSLLSKSESVSRSELFFTRLGTGVDVVAATVSSFRFLAWRLASLRAGLDRSTLSEGLFRALRGGVSSTFLPSATSQFVNLNMT